MARRRRATSSFWLEMVKCAFIGVSWLGIDIVGMGMIVYNIESMII